jgi:hypothetical protein
MWSLSPIIIIAVVLHRSIKFERIRRRLMKIKRIRRRSINSSAIVASLQIRGLGALRMQVAD